MRVRAVAALTLCVLALGAAAAQARPRFSGRPFPRPIQARLQAVVPYVQKQFLIPGMAVAVARTGVGSFTAYAGDRTVAPARPMNPATHFRIGSVTKTFTATVILQLAEAGRLSLDDTIARWEPDIQDASQITIRELLNMTSGIFDEGGPGSLLVKEATADPTRVWSPQEIVNLAIQQGPSGPPGQFAYSDTNYAILGIIAQDVTGSSIEALVRQRILRPLHLSHTTFPANGLDMPAPAATGYSVVLPSPPQPGVVAAEQLDPSVVGAAGAIISTLPDLQIWARALGSGALLTPAMQKQRLTLIPNVFEFPPLSGGEDLSAGYGLGLLDTAGYLGHNGIVNGFTSDVYYDPVTRTTIIVLLNSEVFQVVSVHPLKAEFQPISDAMFVTFAEILGAT